MSGLEVNACCKMQQVLTTKLLKIRRLSAGDLLLADGTADAEGLEFLEEAVGDLYLELVGEELYVPLLDRVVEEHGQRCLSLVGFQHLHELFPEDRGEHGCGDVY